jgi:glycosyltransferase involved in cell wall biosynthesis
VINSLAKKELSERKGISSTVVPNVFDFDPPGWQEDDFNADFRSSIGLKDNDLIILQATRVVARKGIELAIDFVKALDTPERRKLLHNRGLYNGKPFNQDSRIVLVLAGYGRDDITGTYVKNLKTKAAQEGVDMIHIENQVSHERKTTNGHKVYSLWDTYVFADFVTYPSLWEGWGNQFLEAIRAKLPILIFEYPVYVSDIKSRGFDVISLGSHTSGVDEMGLVQMDPKFIQKAADQAVEVLTIDKQRSQVVNHNFQIGKEHFSLAALSMYLENLLKD